MTAKIIQNKKKKLVRAVAVTWTYFVSSTACLVVGCIRIRTYAVAYLSQYVANSAGRR
jgi:hypothetical protein